LKIVQLHPRGNAASRADPAPEFEPENGLSETAEGNAGAASQPIRDEIDGAQNASQSGAEGRAAAPRKLVRKTVITIKRRKVRRAATPAEVLARSLESPHRKLGQSAPHEILEKSAKRTAQPVAQPPMPQGQNDGGEQFWQIWLGHHHYLRAHALRFSGGNFADAEDALSEAMLKAAQTFESSAIHNHRAWLLRLVHNACMDRHRSNRRRSRLAKDITDTDAQSAPAVAIGPDRSPEELLCALQQIGDLQRAMTALPSFLAEPFLRYLDDQSDAEIADSLNVTKEVIRKRRQIVRAMLRRCISP
jgi:RNA polymerase sigma factor (sigma-70 family)